MIKRGDNFYEDIVDSVLRRAAITLVEDACAVSDVEMAGGYAVAHDPDPMVHDSYSVRARIPVIWSVPVWDSVRRMTMDKMIKVHVHTYIDMYNGRVIADTILMDNRVIWEDSVRNNMTPQEKAEKFRSAIYHEDMTTDNDDCEIA